MDLALQTPPTRGEWAVKQLRKAILTGEYQPGARLRMAELADRLQVSPTPLREALQRLASEKLVELEPQRGARVAPIDRAAGLDVYRVRLMLEPPALAAAIRARPDAEWDRRIDSLLSALDAATLAEPFDGAGFAPLHLSFHQLLIEPCGSPWLMRIVRQLQTHSCRFQILSFGLRGGADAVVAEHHQLAELVHSREAEAAEVALRAHIEATVRHVLAQPDTQPAR
jgi:GntR family carbon starvation induced transcriptional regulator